VRHIQKKNLSKCPRERNIHANHSSTPLKNFVSSKSRRGNFNCQLIHLIFPCAILSFYIQFENYFVREFIECVNLDFGKSKGEFREFYVKREKKRERELRKRRRIGLEKRREILCNREL
jgi:hypothetical protein